MNINNQIIIFSASRLVKKNGLKYLIKAMKYLPNNYVLRIAGDGKLKKKLWRLVDRLDLNSRVSLLGFLNKGGLDYYYDMADVVCRPSLSEGFGNIFLEGLGYKCPVVAPNIMGIKDIFDDFSEAMFECISKNPITIAKAIEDSFKADINWDKVHKKIKDKYTWNVVAEQMGNIFKQLNIKEYGRKT